MTGSGGPEDKEYKKPGATSGPQGRSWLRMVGRARISGREAGWSRGRGVCDDASMTSEATAMQMTRSGKRGRAGLMAAPPNTHKDGEEQIPGTQRFPKVDLPKLLKL